MTDEELIAELRLSAAGSAGSAGSVADLAADRLEAMGAALALWMKYDEADFDESVALYRKVVRATESVLKKD